MIEINSQFDFFKNVKLDDDGNLMVALNGSGSTEVFMYDTFADFPATGNQDSLYVAKDANVIYRWDDVLSTYQVLNDPNVVNPDAPEEGQTFYVRVATTTTLNANTYNNGTAGVGATLTGNANGVLSQTNQTGRIDNTVPVVGDIILVKNESSTIKNGIYEVTQVGTAGTPYILTRIEGYDETAEVYPSIIFVSTGSNNLNRYFTQNTANPVIGTNGLVYGVAAVSSPVLPIISVDTYLDDMTTLPGAYTYTTGTTFINLPAYGATLRANANGALGTINGVSMTSGRRILINDPNFPLRNGDYTVSNAGSATQRWQLTRINYANSGFNYFAREWVISNQNSTLYGSRFSLNSGTITDSLIGISQNIIFNKQNNVGLRDVAGTVYIDSISGVTESSVSIEYGGIPKVTLYSTDGTNEGSLEVRGDGSVAIDALGSGLFINVGSGSDDYLQWGDSGSFNIYVESGDANIYAGIANDWYLGDYDTNKAFIKRDVAQQKLFITNNLGEINLQGGTPGQLNNITLEDDGIHLSANNFATLNIFFDYLPTYANNTNPLTVGAVYKTATGELRIKI